MRNLLFLLIIISIVTLRLTVYSQENNEELIQIALLLDTSNSMDGLINQAKSQLWRIVNEFALAQKNGKTPKLEIALYEYGNNSIPVSEGYIRKVVDLTGDLDKISDELFRLTTNGGSEYCGEVIEKAVKDLKWSDKKDVLKIIFIAGNEPFTQGSYNYKKTCKEAISGGIIVNTIFCGNRDEGIRTNWKDGADLADGIFSNIDQNRQIAFISAPQDDEINKLGQELNKTYVAYGVHGMKSKELQAAQDLKAGSISPSVMAQRSAAKASVQYSNEKWDLIDASLKDSLIVEKLEKKELPEEMQNMSKEEQKNYIQSQSQKRRTIQERINQLNSERRTYVAEQEGKNDKDNTLDQAMMNSIRKQAQNKRYVFK
jgi:hypothetical protein